MELLTKKLTEAGYSIAPAKFTPVEPPTAAEANAATQAEAETAVFQAEAAAEVARAEYEANLGGPGEAGAAVRLQAAEAALAAAEREVTDAREARAAAAQAAAACPLLLEQYDVVVWKPRKKMTVSNNVPISSTPPPCSSVSVLSFPLCGSWAAATLQPVVLQGEPPSRHKGSQSQLLLTITLPAVC